MDLQFVAADISSAKISGIEDGGDIKGERAGIDIIGYAIVGDGATGLLEIKDKGGVLDGGPEVHGLVGEDSSVEVASAIQMNDVEIDIDGIAGGQ